MPISSKRVRITYDDGFTMPTFANATLNQIVEVANRYYNSQLSVNTIKQSWHIGDTKTIHLDAIPDVYVGNTYSAQDVQLKIVDFEHDNLSTSINGKTKALLTLGFVLGNKTTVMSISGTNVNGWSMTTLRYFCNDYLLKALPDAIQNGIKIITKSNQTVTQDKIFIPSSKEYNGTSTYDKRGTSLIFNKSSGTDNGVQYELYKNGYTFTKNVVSATTCNFDYSDEQCRGICFIEVNSNQNVYIYADDFTYAMPHFCI